MGSAGVSLPWTQTNTLEPISSSPPRRARFASPSRPFSASSLPRPRPPGRVASHPPSVYAYSLFRKLSIAMCEIECFGNYHRGCEHYVKLYESGNKTDCGSPSCALSVAHKHRAGQRTCTCSKVPRECRRVLSLIHERCDNCTRAAWATLERESGRVW